MSVLFRISLVAFLLLSSIPLQGADTSFDDPNGISWGMYLRKRQYSCTVPNKGLLESPKWNPETEPPPVTIPAAIKLARSWLADAIPSIHDWRLYSIECDFSETTDRWYYEITFSSKSLNREEDDHARIPVLMSGKLGLIKLIR